MASSDGKLVFPVYFDLESAVKQASGDADKVLKRLETTIASRPLKLGVEIQMPENKLKNMAEGSINAMRDEMAKLVEQWNKLSEAQRIANQQTGQYTAEAMKIINRYGQLVAASESYAKSLSQIASAARKAADDEIKGKEKAIQRSRELVALLTNESHARDILNQKLKFYTAQMNSAEPGTNKWAFNAQMVKQLREQIDLLDIKTKNVTGNTVKAEEKAAQARAKETAAVGTLSQAYDALKAKLSALQSIRSRTDKSINPKEWQHATEEIIKTNHALTVLTAVQKASTQTLFRETEAVRTMVRELRVYGDTLGQLQTKLSAYQSLLNNTKVGGNAFTELSLQIRRANEEFARGKQLAADYQQKAFIGLGDAKTKQKVAEVTQLRDKIAELDKQMNSLRQRGADVDANGNLTKQMVGLLDQRIATETKLNNILLTGAESAKRKLEAEKAAQEEIQRKRQEAIDAANKANQANQAAANQSRRNYELKRQEGLEIQRILNSQTNSYDALSKKLAALEALRNRSQVGTDRWKNTTKAIDETREKLAKVTEAMNKTANEAERLARIREIFSMSTKSMEGLNARLGEYNSRLQKCDVGTKAFESTALLVARLSEELQRASRYAQDFAQKAFQGLNAGDTYKRVQELQTWRNELRTIDEQYNKLRNTMLQSGSNPAIEAQINTLLGQRMDVVKKIDNTLRTAEQAQLEREKEITAEMERQRKKAEEVAKAQQRRQERNNLLTSQAKDLDTLTRKLQYYQSLLSKIDPEIKPQSYAAVANHVRRLADELQRASQYMNDFQQKAFIGVGDTLVNRQVERLRDLRSEIKAIDADLNVHRQLLSSGRGSSLSAQAVNRLLDERIAKTKEINDILKTAEQQQLEREKEINRIIESRRAKQKANSDAVRTAVQARKQERAMLLASERTVENITKKLQYWQTKLNTTDMRSGEFTKIAKEVERLTRKLDEARKKIADMTGQSTSGASKQAANVRQVNQEYSKQYTYLDRLIRRMAVYASVGMIGNFLTKVREVTAQFELQRISLGAILQDQNKANQLFSEIKSFALKSPVSILDLTKYTKQLAAYKIGYDELFETTKKLTDVSVGLGVSMDRVVLAYGQVRATGHLRASEVRQFTEMGVPIVEELAAKLSKMNGEMVTAAQVMDMISKRAISFDMVKDVFDDMTSAGGIFYNMQEKQGNTLYGLWAKLGDAASVMYSEIGNTGIVNDAMKGIISSFTALMKNWRAVGLQLTALAAGFGLYKLMQSLSTVNTMAASRATRDLARAQVQLAAAQKGSLWGMEASARASANAARYYRLAALQTKVLAAAGLRLRGVWQQLKAVFLGNWITLAITAVAAISAAICSAHEKANRLRKELEKLQAETVNLQNQSANRLEQLANTAVSAANGSKEQRDALDELKRAYKDIIPEESLTLENLRSLKAHYDNLPEKIKKTAGAYDVLTKSVREYIAEQQREKGLNAISEKYGAEITDSSKKLIDGLVSEMKIGRDVAAQIVGEMQRDHQEKLAKGEKETRNITKRMVDAAKKYGVEMSNLQAASASSPWYELIWLDSDYLVDFYNALDDMNRETQDWENQVKGTTGEYGKLLDKINEIKEEVKNVKIQDAEGKAVDADSFFGQQIKANFTMQQVADAIKNDPTLPDALRGKIEECMHIVESVDPKDLGNITTVNFDAILEVLDGKYPEFQRNIELFQKEWGNVAPTNQTALQIRNQLFVLAESFKAPMERMARYLWDGSGSVDDYLKRLKEQQEELKARIKVKQTTLEHSAKLSLWFKKWIMGEDIEAELKELKAEAAALDKLIPYVTEYTVPKKDKNKGGGRKSDTRLQELQGINQTLEKINKEYDELSKKEGKTKALDDIRKQFKNTIDYTNKLGKKFGLYFDYPTEFKTLQDYRAEILKVMKSLKNLKGGEKAILDFETMIGKADSDHLQKQIESQLKALSDRISRTKTAKEFYDKILASTGDYELAGQIADGIFGQDGRKLQSMLAEQVRSLTNGLELPGGIISPDNIINNKALREWAEANKDELGDMYKELVKISEDGQKNLAKSYEGYLKDLEKAKTYADKRVELARETAEKIREIESEVKAGSYTKEQGENLKRGYLERETSEEAKLEWDAFKDMPIYTQMFEDMEHASTSTLTMMKNHLTGLKGLWGSALDPTQIKEIQGRIEEIEKQLETRNPWKTLRTAFGNYKDALSDYNPGNAVRNVGMASEELLNTYNAYGKDSAQAKMAEQELGVQKKILEISRQLTDDKGKRLKGTKALDKANQLAYRNQLSAQQDLNDALADEQEAITKYGEDSEQYKAAHAVVEEKKEELKIAEKVSEITQENADTATKWKDSMATAVSEITKYMTMASDAARSIADLTEAFGGSEEDVQFWNDIADGLENVTAGFSDLMQNIMSLNIAGIISSAITAIPKMIIGFMDIFSAGKIRKANKEIKKQQELLEQLEYTYSRLEKASERLFGKDYLQNHNQRLRALEAERQAYLKQARAEQSKGKKEDKAKTKEYLDNARDVADEIAELQDDLVSQITGTDVASAARDFANAWLDAYISFESTTGAIKEKFNDMIKNMIANMVMARVVEKALQPIFEEIDRLAADGNLTADDIGRVFAMVPQSMEDINNGLGVALRGLEAAGIDIRSLGENADSVSDIAKSVAGATSEEINNLAAIGNTLMYYVSTLPRIDEKISRIVTIMESGGAGIGSASATGWTDWQQQAMDNYLAIQRNTADTVVECRRAADACEASVKKLSRIITDKGSVSGVNVFMKG